MKRNEWVNRNFGAELRRRRFAAGMTLSQLAKVVNYSKGHLSKVERGDKPPSRDLARHCDVVLEAEGELAALVPVVTKNTGPIDGTTDNEGWMMYLDNDGQNWFGPVGRRQAIAMGAISLAGMRVSVQGTPAGLDETAALSGFGSLFPQLRQLGQAVAPSEMLPILITQVHTLRRMAQRSSDRHRPDVLALGSRYAEYTGWMAQEAGDNRAALWWTNMAVEMAQAGDDTNLSTYSLVRRALITLYADDAEQTIALAAEAARADVPPRIKGLAAQREAQGHALAGDYRACMSALDTARDLLARDDSGNAPILGSSHVPDQVAMSTGWCLHDLGRSREAADLLDAEIRRLLPTAVRSRTRYGVRQALAHASAGDIDQACRVADSLLDGVHSVRSATVTIDLRRLTHVLARYRTNHAVRDLYPRLVASISAFGV
ncbi:Helix-turn-helix domain-containing protein [Streptosporangium canum]|uniref:Helix-turn-helix domain-containing protein n=1 Tax=Streptosporangium canum TaxID=324952 RepID=A0A1I4F6I5_9ACTN|nr:helix-turn-helix transcriptional regulator [Streptosporangium canum]SFL13578.1 Helix-turn-helix domain-containing protein [Streptosporangium canum]